MAQSPKQILSTLLRVMRKKGYLVYDRPFELNIVGLRGQSRLSGTYDDEIFVFYKDELNQYQIHLFPATTDPGLFWLNNPKRPAGTAMLAEGQYKDTYQIGLHRGKSVALVQAKPVRIHRVVGRKGQWQASSPIYGNFGINIHSASLSKIAGDQIGLDSAGCQVIPARQFAGLLLLARKHTNLYGNRLSYSLIDFRSYAQDGNRLLLIGIGISALLLWAIRQIGQSSVVLNGGNSQILGSLDDSSPSIFGQVLDAILPDKINQIAKKLLSK